jgi:hypothetical protein
MVGIALRKKYLICAKCPLLRKNFILRFDYATRIRFSVDKRLLGIFATVPADEFHRNCNLSDTRLRHFASISPVAIARKFNFSKTARVFAPVESGADGIRAESRYRWKDLFCRPGELRTNEIEILERAK